MLFSGTAVYSFYFFIAPIFGILFANKNKHPFFNTTIKLFFATFFLRSEYNEEAKRK
jgi:hypothetical protein